MVRRKDFFKRAQVLFLIVCFLASFASGCGSRLDDTDNLDTQETITIVKANKTNEDEEIEINQDTVAEFISGLDDIAVIVGSEDVNLLSLISYDETVVSNVSLDEGELSYSEEGEFTVTYYVNIDADALSKVIAEEKEEQKRRQTIKEAVAQTGSAESEEPSEDEESKDTGNISDPAEVASATGNEAEVEFSQHIYVISEESVESFIEEKPDVPIYTTGTVLYENLNDEPEPEAQDTVEEQETANETNTEETTLSYTVTEVNPYTMYAQVSLNVRSGPNANAQKLFVLSTNESVTVSAEADNGWVYVTNESGHSGYCSGKYLGEEKVVVQQTTNTTNSSGSSSSNSSSSSTVVDGCITRGNCTDSQWSKVISYWYQVPSGLRNSFISSGWQMFVTNDDFWTAQGFGGWSIAGLTVYTEKMIYIHPDYMRSITVAHEMGHYLDWVYNYPSQTDEFMNLFNLEKDGFIEYDNYENESKWNTREYFATIACQLFLAPNTESSAPQSFAYVRQYMLW